MWVELSQAASLLESKNDGRLQKMGEVCSQLYLGLGFTFGPQWEKTSNASEKLEVSVSDIDGGDFEERKQVNRSRTGSKYSKAHTGPNKSFPDL